MNLPCLPPLPLHALSDGSALLLCGHLHLCLCHLGDLDDDAVRACGQTHKRDVVPRGDTIIGKQCDKKEEKIHATYDDQLETRGQIMLLLLVLFL